MFTQIYECPGCECKETWQVAVIQQIDAERDDVWDQVVCRNCGSSDLKPKIDEEGNRIMHVLTEEEFFWETYLESDEDEL
ncbi:MAG: hypothetical protein AAGF96_18735 [Bacteroidota bacterium]